ncbi:MAG: branched-chain amino acid ABC transporter permease [Hyphomicrobiaceae bacterium]|nr:branched-chain amino acid ABC transporter permease [Hyphomicrobiaceae bacterium]
MDIWIQQLINALTIGGMYTLVAVGFTIFFGVLRLINFAHGEVFMFAAFVALAVSSICVAVGITNGPVVIILMFLFAMGTCAALGGLLERIAFKPLRGMPPLLLLVTSLAVGIVIREAVKEFYPEGANPQAFFSPYAYNTFQIGGVTLSYTQIGLVAVSVILVFCVYLLVTRTWMGRAMRATSEDRDAALMMGVDVDAVIRNAFFIGSALGAAAGVMNGLFYQSVRFDMGWVMGIKGFTAAVIGGLGNVYGAIFGGYALALFEVLVVALVPNGSQYKDVFVFMILIAILVFRPSGLLGTPQEKVG